MAESILKLSFEIGCCVGFDKMAVQGLEGPRACKIKRAYP
jgi:hypothetical protein